MGQPGRSHWRREMSVSLPVIIESVFLGVLTFHTEYSTQALVSLRLDGDFHYFRDDHI